MYRQNLDTITINTFRKIREREGKNTKHICDARIGRYLSKLNRHLRDLTLLSNKKFIYNSHRDGVWIVDLG